MEFQGKVDTFEVQNKPSLNEYPYRKAFENINEAVHIDQTNFILCGSVSVSGQLLNNSQLITS